MNELSDPETIILFGWLRPQLTQPRGSKNPKAEGVQNAKSEGAGRTEAPDPPFQGIGKGMILKLNQGKLHSAPLRGVYGVGGGGESSALP